MILDTLAIRRRVTKPIEGLISLDTRERFLKTMANMASEISEKVPETTSRIFTHKQHSKRRKITKGAVRITQAVGIFTAVTVAIGYIRRMRNGG